MPVLTKVRHSPPQGPGTGMVVGDCWGVTWPRCAAGRAVTLQVLSVLARVEFPRSAPWSASSCLAVLHLWGTDELRMSWCSFHSGFRTSVWLGQWGGSIFIHSQSVPTCCHSLSGPGDVGEGGPSFSSSTTTPHFPFSLASFMATWVGAIAFPDGGWNGLAAAGPWHGAGSEAWRVCWGGGLLC